MVQTVSRDQILRRERGHREKIFFRVQLTTSRIGYLTRLILSSSREHLAGVSGLTPRVEGDGHFLLLPDL